jgi:hypothetical protein
MGDLMKLRISVLIVLAFAVTGASCQPDLVQGQATSALGDHKIQKIAVVPLAISAGIPEPTEGAGTTPSVAATIVAHQLTEALAARGIEMVAPSDMARVLELAGEELATPRPLVAARIAASEFGADAILSGTLIRWVERGGSARGAADPAAVGFEISLRATPGAARLWNGTFDERQKPLGENVLVTSQYPGGGTRWLTAEELARWGARQLVAAIPLN